MFTMLLENLFNCAMFGLGIMIFGIFMSLFFPSCAAGFSMISTGGMIFVICAAANRYYNY